MFCFFKPWTSLSALSEVGSLVINSLRSRLHGNLLSLFLTLEMFRIKGRGDRAEFLPSLWILVNFHQNYFSFSLISKYLWSDGWPVIGSLVSLSSVVF